MIRVVFDPAKVRLNIEGHAGHAPRGQDTVCAAASTLMFALAKAVDELHERHAVTEPVLKLDSGTAEISCKPINGYQYSISLMFRAICGGFQLLADHYPENISYKVEG